MTTLNDDIIYALRYGVFQFQAGVLKYITEDPRRQDSASNWLKEHRIDIENLIINELRLKNAYRFVNYSTGSYGPKKSDGVTLTFDNISSGNDAYCIFNADIRYQRGVKAGQKLPKKRFKVKPRSKLSKLLKAAKINPRRPSEYHEHMGKLKNLIYTAELKPPSTGSKLLKDSVKPLHIDTEELTKLLLSKQNEQEEFSAIDRQFFGKCSADNRQQSSASNWHKACDFNASSKNEVRANLNTDIRSQEMRTHDQYLDPKPKEPFSTISLSDCTVEAWIVENIEESKRLEADNDWTPF